MSSSWVTDPGEVDGVEQSELGREALQREAVPVADRTPDQPEAGVGVVEPPVGREGLDQVVLSLVRGDLADEEQVRAPRLLVGGQPCRRRGIGRAREALEIDEEGHGRRRRGNRPPAARAR